MPNLLSATGHTQAPHTHVQRQSNMELFRCLAMLLVVGVHANFATLQPPTQLEAQTAPLASLTRFGIETICAGAVNMFVLLSGWFGIHVKVKSLGKLLFQTFFCTIGLYIVFAACGKTPWNISGLYSACLFGYAYWFVKAYLGLYLLSPFINSFLRQATRGQTELFLIGYFVFQLLYGWLDGGSANFNYGYSTLSFVFLYVLAHYVRRYHFDHLCRLPRLTFPAAFLIIVLLQSALAWQMRLHGLRGMLHLYDYTSPTLIFTALCLLLTFARMHFQSRAVNYVAASSFSVYLLHMTPGMTMDYYVSAIHYLWQNLNGLLCLLALSGLAVLMFLLCTLADQLRRACWWLAWRVLRKYVPSRIDNELAHLP